MVILELRRARDRALIARCWGCDGEKFTHSTLGEELSLGESEATVAEDDGEGGEAHVDRWRIDLVQ